MEKTKKKSVDLGKDKVSKIFFSYAITSIIAMLVQSTAGLVDSIFIGRYVGPSGLSAITLSMPFIIFLGGVGTMIAIGGTTLAGIYRGKKELEKSNNFFNVTLSLLVISALFGTCFFLLVSDMLANLLGAHGEVAQYMTMYLKILSVFFMPFLLTFALSFFLKLDGKPVVVVIVLLSGTVMNIFLDYLLVGMLGLKMAGAAIATGMSQLLPCLLALYFTKYRSSWQFKKPVFELADVSAMLLNGSSELMSVGAGSIAGFIFNIIIINQIGVDGVAAYAVALQITAVSTSIFYGFAESIQSAVSYNIGANKLDRVKAFRNLSVYANLSAGILLFLIVTLFGKPLAHLFVQEPKIVALAVQILFFYGFAFILSGMNITLATYYTSVNSPLISAMLSLSRSLVFLMIGLIVMPMIFGSQGIWMAVIFSECMTILIARLCLKRYPYGSAVKVTY